MRTLVTPVLRAALAVALLAGAASVAHAQSLAAAPGPLTGELQVHNERPQTITLYVDGQRLGDVLPRQTRRFAGVLNGVRQVAWSSGGRYESERITVGVNQRAVLRIAPITGSTLVLNRTGVEVRVTLRAGPGGQPGAVDLGRLRDGASAGSPELLPGSYLVTATPLGRHAHLAPVTTRATVVAGQVQDVVLAPMVGSVAVSNPSRRAATLWIDGRSSGRVPAGGRLLVEGVTPGTLSLQLRQGNRVLAAMTARLVAGQRLVWDGHPAPVVSPPPVVSGALELRNGSGHALTVAIDERELGRLRPSERRTFAGLPLGRVDLLITSPRHTWVESVVVRPNAPAQLTLRPPAQAPIPYTR